jgi:hypothetical protein
LSLTGTKQSIVLPTKSKSLEAITSKVVFLLSVTIALVVDDPPVTHLLKLQSFLYVFTFITKGEARLTTLKY